MKKTTIKIEGMMCGMCETHIKDVIRKTIPSAKKVTASRKKKEATFMTKDLVDEEALKQAIDATGYECISIESVV